MKTYRDQIERLEAKVRELERFRDITVGALDPATGQRFPEKLEAWREPRFHDGLTLREIAARQRTIAALKAGVPVKAPEEYRGGDVVYLTGNPLIHRAGCSSLHIDPSTRKPWPCSCGAVSSDRPKSPAPTETPPPAAKEPAAMVDLAAKLAEHLATHRATRDLVPEDLGFTQLRQVVEHVLRAYLNNNEGTDICVASTTTGKVYIGIIGGQTIRMELAAAERTLENLTSAIRHAKTGFPTTL